MSTHAKAESRDRAAYYRDMANAAMGGAEQAATPEIRLTYLDLAKAWNALAEAVERVSDDEAPNPKPL